AGQEAPRPHRWQETDEGRAAVEEAGSAGAGQEGARARHPPEPPPPALAPRRLGPGPQEARRQDPQVGARDLALVRRPAPGARRGGRVPGLARRRRARRRGPRPLPEGGGPPSLDQGPPGLGGPAEDQARGGERAVPRGGSEEDAVAAQ